MYLLKHWMLNQQDKYWRTLRQLILQVRVGVHIIMRASPAVPGCWQTHGSSRTVYSYYSCCVCATESSCARTLRPACPHGSAHLIFERAGLLGPLFLHACMRSQAQQLDDERLLDNPYLQVSAPCACSSPHQLPGGGPCVQFQCWWG